MDKMKLIAIGALVVCFALQMNVDANGGRRGQQAQNPEQTQTAEQGKRQSRRHEHRRQGKQGERRGQHGKRQGQCKGGTCTRKSESAQSIKPLQQATVAPSVNII